MASPDNKPVITLTVTIDIPLERAVNCIVGGLENGYSSWLRSFRPTKDPETVAAIESIRNTHAGQIWYSVEDFWRLGGRVTMIYDGPEEDEGEGQTTATVDLLGLSLALNRMNRVAPRHFSDLVAENDDAVTHDVFMQFLVFEEIIYG
jgi:hypothetical protein